MTVSFHRQSASIAAVMTKLIRLLLLSPLPWLAHANAASCSSDQCVDFATYSELVDHIHTEQKLQAAQQSGATAAADDDDELIVVCLCGKAYQGSNVCPTFPYQETVDGSLVEYSEMALTITRSVMLSCVTTDEPCLMDCPQTPVTVKSGGSLELIAVRGSLVWSNTAEATKSSKLRVDSGASQSYILHSILPSSDQLEGGAISNAGSLQIYDSWFQNCSSRLHGGAIHVSTMTSSLDVRRTEFQDNTAPVGGAISLSNDVPWARILACNFAGTNHSDLEALEATASMYNETVDSNSTDSVFWRTSEGNDYEFCDNTGLNDFGCNSGSSISFSSSFVLLIQLASLGAVAFLL
uniref:Uncharacterized protein n=1 Tax=Ditylum brightwellii TaxID=49249 RepID=A0A7S2ECJ2_9STRA|mmetsp:Transcript_24439/g.36470  ORF Transcript_24439/g.36470 Transcript_24439/m.36470 type:complete len:352 (+) Transcript_24439:990-2045(+)